MIININKKDYSQLLKICRKSLLEQNGLIRLKIEDNKVYFLDYYESNNEEIVSRTENKIEFETNNFIKYQMLTTLLFDPSKEIWVNYHTHPGISAINEPSEADINTLKRRTYLRNKVYEQGFKIEPPIQIDAIITEDEVGFYSVINGEVIKHTVCLDRKIVKKSNNMYVKMLKRKIKRIID